MNDSAMAPSQTQATIGFVTRMASPLKLHNFDRSKDRLEFEQRNVAVGNARELPVAPELDREGFTLVRSPSGVADFASLDQAMSDYVPRLEALVRELTGATKVVAIRMPFVRRNKRPRGPDSGAASGPIRFAHGDFVGGSFWPHALATLGPRRPGRYAVYNVWRVLSPPPQDAPLALCDLGSISPGDRRLAEAINDPPGEPATSEPFALLRNNPRQRWYYYPDMDPDEALVFKSFDTASKGSGVPHAAFDDPRCPAGTRCRESIDVRVFAYFQSSVIDAA